MSDIMGLIYPQGKDTIFNTFADSIEKTVIPPIEDFPIVLYDEQHPKKGRTQKFRLTLLDSVTGQPIAEELHDSKTSLKTHRKKQLRTDNGIENQMKLAAMKRAGLLGRCKKTLLGAFLMFVPFLDHG
jgi:hypothetical protein